MICTAQADALGTASFWVSEFEGRVTGHFLRIRSNAMADEWDDDELDVAQLQSEAAAAAPAAAAAAAAHGNDDEDGMDWEDGDAAHAEGMLHLLHQANHLQLP
jgi:hypothetical protein